MKKKQIDIVWSVLGLFLSTILLHFLLDSYEKFQEVKSNIHKVEIQNKKIKYLTAKLYEEKSKYLIKTYYMPNERKVYELYRMCVQFFIKEKITFIKNTQSKAKK